MCRSAVEPGEPAVPPLCNAGRQLYAEAVRRGSIGAEEALDCLIELRLLESAGEGSLVPVAPGTAATLFLGPLRLSLQHQAEVIASMEAVYGSVDQAYRDARQGISIDIRLIRGADHISSVLQAAVDGCQEELLTIQPGGGRPHELLERALAKEVQALRRGVRQQTIYQHSIRSHGPTLEYVRGVTAAGAAVRTTDEVIDRLIICDRQVAFIPTTVPRGDEALEISHPALVRFLARLFEIIWSRAVPWNGLGATPVKPEVVATEMQRTIMRMLVNGYTQSRVARELGMSLRTLTTHVSKISGELGSASPIQLGYIIAARGVLEREIED